MANPNWRAEVEQALSEQDRSDPTADNVFQNRGLARYYVVGGILSIFIGIISAYIGKCGDPYFSRDDRNWFEGFSWLCWMAAAVQIPMGMWGIFVLRQKKPAASRFQNVQSSGGPPIGW